MTLLPGQPATGPLPTRLLARARRRAPRSLRDLARHAFSDPLTGLPNRLLFDDRLGQAFARARRQQRTVAVLFCDLDGFKQVNDTLGHRAGDALLQAVAGRLRSVVRPMDTVARLGGDEFTILLEQLEDPADALKLAGRVSRCLHTPIVIDATPVTVSASIGVAYARDGHADPADVLAEADAAMYRSKRQGPGHVVVFDPALQARRERRLAIGAALRQAVERSELALVYEPVVDLATGRVSAAQAQHGWHRTGGRAASSRELYAAADDLGLAAALGRQALRAAADQAQRWARGGDDPLGVTVDLPPAVFRDEGLPRLVAALTDGLAPGMLDLQVAEALVVRDPVTAQAVCERLAQVGAGVTLDMHSDGPSAFNLLPDLPLSGLKVPAGLDASRMRALATYAEARNLTAAVTGVADTAGLERARRSGMSAAQGPLLSPALSGDEVVARHRRRRPAATGRDPQAVAWLGRDRRAAPARRRLA